MRAHTLGWIFIVVVLTVLLIVCMPIAIIWALNTLFGLSIPFTLKTWMAALLLSAPFTYKARTK